MKDKKEDIVISLFAFDVWNNKSVWIEVLQAFNEILGKMPEKLDTNDPLRRKFLGFSVKENSEYICNFEKQETYRMLFGSYPKNSCDFSIYIGLGDDFGVSTLDIYFPFEDTERAEELFRKLIPILQPAYAYVDLQSMISAKRRADGFSVNSEEELPGVFWLTYLCKTYTSYFGDEKIQSLNVKTVNILEKGTLLKLARYPVDLTSEFRISIEEIISRLSFVNPESSILKPTGKYVPSHEKFLA